MNNTPLIALTLCSKLCPHMTWKTHCKNALPCPLPTAPSPLSPRRAIRRVAHARWPSHTWPIVDHLDVGCERHPSQKRLNKYTSHKGSPASPIRLLQNRDVKQCEMIARAQAQIWSLVELVGVGSNTNNERSIPSRKVHPNKTTSSSPGYISQRHRSQRQLVLKQIIGNVQAEKNCAIW